MAGLENLVGSDLDGPPRDLDVSTLRASYKAKERLASHSASQNIETAGKKQAAELMSPTEPLSPSGSTILSPMSKASRHSLGMSASKELSVDWSDASYPVDLARSGSGSPQGVSFLDTQTFTNSASAKALHSATADRRQARRVNGHQP